MINLGHFLYISNFVEHPLEEKKNTTHIDAQHPNTQQQQQQPTTTTTTTTKPFRSQSPLIKNRSY